jgi:putative PIN family toxin of toxin-antitoxin system
MKAVLDTNVLIAAYLTEGLCARLLRRARRRQFELITCLSILEECRIGLKRLTSPRPEALQATLRQLQEIAISITPAPSVIPKSCRDPADNVVLGCAIAAQADYLVTGDRDLLDLHPFRDLPILLPRAFEALFTD